MNGERITKPVAVASRSFSKHAVLRRELEERFSTIRFNDKGLSLAGEELISFLEGCYGAIIALEHVDDQVLSALPQLKVIAKYGVGLDNLDQEAMERHGVALGWTGGVNATSVSELALAFTLGMFRSVFPSSRRLASGVWRTEGGRQLTGKTVGVIGCGYVGKDFIRILQPFKCRVLIHDILDLSEFCASSGAVQLEKDELLRESDVVSLHVPYDASTHRLIGKRELSLMKPSAILVNTSRGGVVDEDALLEALAGNKISAAGMDVFAREPEANPDLLKLPNFVGTPHIGGSAEEAILAMGRAAITSLVRCCG